METQRKKTIKNHSARMPSSKMPSSFPEYLYHRFRREVFPRLDLLIEYMYAMNRNDHAAMARLKHSLNSTSSR